MVRALLFTCLAVLAGLSYAQTYKEHWRPQYHFTPAKNFMNDPNGLVFYKGEYHLFYQHNPEGNRWGHMSWGHAVSADMLHWKHLPLAIAERPTYMIYSGSAVIDWNNTSGLCKVTRNDRSCMIAIFTAATDDTWQRQHIAFSNDRGRTWTEYAGNPVADLKLPNFRDPKVFWYAPMNKWVMVSVVA
jgi:sucrose-6-phosphate hydrolase SacC (GH32 family)